MRREGSRAAHADRGVVTRSAVLDELLAASSAVLGPDAVAYRHHAYRVLNFALALAPAAPALEHKLATACFFHDLGIWTDRTFDYLAPSARRARAHLDAQGHTGWADEIVAMIAEHHRIRPATHLGPLVEAFREADWIDVSLGWRRFGLSKDFVAGVQRAFPNAGFHRRLVGLTVERLRRHPLSPLPMLRW